MHQALHVERSIEDLASRRYGVFSRAEALALGATRAMLDHRRASGRWPLVLPGVHRVAAVAPTAEQLWMAACLWSGADGLLSHETAARIWRFDGIVSADAHVTVPGSRRLRSDLVVVHRSQALLPADLASRGPFRVTSPLRTAIDLAGRVDEAVLELAIESALRRGQFSPGQLRWRAEALLGKGRPGSTALRRLLDRRTLGRAESGWEVRVARLLVEEGFPPPVPQHEVRVRGRFVARVDLAYLDARVVLEYDSDRWHHGVARRHGDAARRNALRALGWTVIEVTPAMLRDPDALIAAVRAVLAG